MAPIVLVHAAEAPATYLLYMYDMYMTPPPTPRLAYGRSSKGVEKWFHFYGHVYVCVCAVCNTPYQIRLQYWETGGNGSD